MNPRPRAPVHGKDGDGTKAEDARGVLVQLSEAYACKASPLHQALDTMAVGTLAMATVLVVYMLVFGTFPFNAAISGIASCLGFCILTVSLRLHLSKPELAARGEMQALGECLACMILLFCAAFNFIG